MNPDQKIPKEKCLRSAFGPLLFYSRVTSESARNRADSTNRTVNAGRVLSGMTDVQVTRKWAGQKPVGLAAV